MATYSSKGAGADFKPCPEGTHMAVCTLIADVGMQPGSGKFPDPKIKVYLRWEVPGERVTNEEGDDIGPAIVFANYTASMHENAKLRGIITSWRGKSMTDQEAEQFDVRKLLGQACMLQVVHSTDGKYANVKNVMAPPKGMAKPKPEGTQVYYGPDDDAQYEELPKFLREKVDNQLRDPTGPTSQTYGLTSMTTSSGNSRTTSELADAEADRIAAQQAAKRSNAPVEEEFDDPIPF